MFSCQVDDDFVGLFGCPGSVKSENVDMISNDGEFLFKFIFMLTKKVKFDLIA